MTDSERKFRTLVSNIPGICYCCVNDPDYTIEFVSDAVEARTAYPASDFLGNRARSLISAYHPGDLPLVVKAPIGGRSPSSTDSRSTDMDVG